MILKRSYLWLLFSVGNAKEPLEVQKDVRERKIKEISKRKGEIRWAKQGRMMVKDILMWRKQGGETEWWDKQSRGDGVSKGYGNKTGAVRKVTWKQIPNEEDYGKATVTPGVKTKQNKHTNICCLFIISVLKVHFSYITAVIYALHNHLFEATPTVSQHSVPFIFYGLCSIKRA